MGEHAKISPSAAHRWISCTPSIKLEEQFPESTSEYAEEGTTAHKLGEVLILEALKRKSPLWVVDQIQAVKATKYYSKELQRYAEEYRDYVLEQYATALSYDKQAKLFIEYKLDLSSVIPGSFGTGDVVIVSNNELHLIDLKYGKGVPVDAEENPQQMLYAKGAIDDFSLIYDIVRVIITIYQPRINNSNSWLTTAKHINNWVEEVAAPAAKRAFEGLGEFNAGHHCQFCRAKPMCKAFADYNLEIAREEFTDPDLLSPEEVSEILLKASIFTGWIKAVKDYAKEQALKGAKWPGMKLVEGKADRIYADEEAAAKTLIEDGWYSESAIYEKKLLGITAMELYLGKKLFAKYLEAPGHVKKPTGAPTLVPATDKRPELNSHESAVADFSQFKTEEI